jgi:hypothetical protein
MGVFGDAATQSIEAVYETAKTAAAAATTTQHLAEL